MVCNTFAVPAGLYSFHYKSRAGLPGPGIDHIKGNHLARIALWCRLSALVLFFSLAQPASAVEYTTQDYLKAVNTCAQVRDYACEEKNYRQLLRLHPNDTTYMFHIGRVLADQDKHKDAIEYFEKAISLGEGAWNLFGYYAASLAAVGRTDDAIDWSYKTLSVMPKLYDTRTNLIKYLVLKKRYYEAISVIDEFDVPAQAKGDPPYFGGQRIAIESTLDRLGLVSPVEAKTMRLPKADRFFFVPVTTGIGKPMPFILDTGASSMMVSDEFLQRSDAHAKFVKNIVIRNADGHASPAREIIIDSIFVGSFELKNVQAVSCQSCVLLLGQTVISHFNVATSKVQGVEFATLSLR
jgi:tetratricopeptide (TPR) repeat protein